MNTTSRLPRQAIIREVGLRDGLQSIARILPTAHKREWIRAAHAAGQREIEVGSFVPARLLPQLADTAELAAFAKTLPGLVVSVLVPTCAAPRRRLPAARTAWCCPCRPAVRTAWPLTAFGPGAR